MSKKLTFLAFKFALVATLGLALTLTFSCSSDDGGGSSSQSSGNDVSSSPSGNGGGSSSSVGECYSRCPSSSSSVKSWSCPDAEIGDNTLSCGGQIYRTVKIGEQVWMAENLNYRGTEPDTLGVCYGNDLTNCGKYSRLYSWWTAMGICPTGWHLPSGADWNVLMKSVNRNCSNNEDCAGAGTKLKAKSDWNPDRRTPAGTDTYDFTALPGGYRGYGYNSFLRIGEYGYWWSSSEGYSNEESSAYLRIMTYDSENAIYGLLAKSALLSSVRCLQD